MLKDFKPANPIALYGWATVQKKETRDHKPYFFLGLSFEKEPDSFCMVWDNHTLFKPISALYDSGELSSGRLYGCWTITDCKPDAKTSGYRLNLSEFEVAEYEEPSRIDLNALKKRLRKHLSDLEEPYKLIVRKLFEMPDVNAGFFESPVTETSSHNYRGGLLAHTVRLLDLIEAMGEVLNQETLYLEPQRPLNLGLMKCAGFFHDIGKIQTYRLIDGQVLKTKEGELFEQSYLGAKLLNAVLDACELDLETRQQLEHVTTSSQERLSFGALNSPRTKEAIAFHLVERLEMKMAHFDTLELMPTQSGFTKMFEKVVYIPDLPDILEEAESTNEVVVDEPIVENPLNESAETEPVSEPAEGATAEAESETTSPNPETETAPLIGESEEAPELAAEAHTAEEPTAVEDEVVSEAEAS